MINHRHIREKVNQYAKIHGFKAANLLVLSEEGIAIPAFLPISHQDCLNHLDQYQPEWRELWNQFVILQQQNTSSLTPQACELLAKIRALILKTFVDIPFVANLLTDFLENQIGNDELLMVRSTGIEDSEECSNPGGNDSISGVKPDLKTISTAIGNVISSYFSENSLQQRLKSTSDNQIFVEAFIPVFMQKMIKETDDGMIFSGVMYTGEHGIFIQAAPGHNELVVNGKGLVDSYYVTDAGVIHSQIYEKSVRLKLNSVEQAGKLHKVLNEKSLRENSTLSPDVLKRVVELGRRVETLYGKPRDIEFVYDERSDTVFLVQARPIPEKNDEKLMPRAISPQKIKAVKAAAKARNEVLVYGKTISPYGLRAQVITLSTEILVCHSIKEALDKVLHVMSDEEVSNLKLVIVKREAPPSSHEAAEFNALGKLVMFAAPDDAELIKARINNTAVIIADPQRKLFLQTESEETANNLLQEGIFKSVLPAERSILQQSYLDKSAQTEASIESSLRKFLGYTDTESLGKKAQDRGLSLYAFLIDLLEDIEGVDGSAEKILVARQALGIIVKTFVNLFRHEKETESLAYMRKKALLLQVIAYACDIDDGIDCFSKDSSNISLQLALLNKVNGLEALIVNAGRRKLYSDSLCQLAVDHHAQQRLATQHPEKLSRIQSSTVRDEVVQLCKLSDLAVNEELGTNWIEFVFGHAGVISKSKDFEKLKVIVHYVLQHNLASLLINNVFANGYELSSIFKMICQSKESLENNEFYCVSLEIDEWEGKISGWADEKFYQAHISKFQQFMVSTIEKLNNLGRLNNLPVFARAQVLQEMQRLTDVIDLSIKEVISSRYYSDDTRKALNLITMLESYYQFLQYFMEYSDNSSYKKSLDKLFKEYCKRLRGMELRQEDFNETSTIKDREKWIANNIKRLKSSLQLSDRFYVDAALITNTGSTWHALSPSSLHDYFSLFHQNMIALISFLSSGFQLQFDILPENIGMMDSKIKKMGRVSVLRSEVVNSRMLLLQYNIAMNDHSAQFLMEYHLKTRQVKLIPKVFGINRGGRTRKVADKLNLVLADFLPSFYRYFLNDKPNTVVMSTRAKAMTYDGKEMPLEDNGQLGMVDAEILFSLNKKTDESELLIYLLQAIIFYLDLYAHSDRSQFDCLESEISMMMRHNHHEKKLQILEKRQQLHFHPIRELFIQWLRSCNKSYILNDDFMERMNYTPLMKAVEQGDINAIHEILKNKESTELNKTNIWGDTAAKLALWNENLDVLEALLPYLDRTVKGELLGQACETGNIKIIELFNEKGGKIFEFGVDPYPAFNGTWLTIAARHGHHHAIPILMKRSDLKDAFSNAYDDGSRAFAVAIKMNATKVVAACLPYVGNINAICSQYPSLPPILLAIRSGSFEVIQQLLLLKVDLSVTDEKRKTVYDYAEESSNIEIKNLFRLLKSYEVITSQSLPTLFMKTVQIDMRCNGELANRSSLGVSLEF